MSSRCPPWALDTDVSLSSTCDLRHLQLLNLTQLYTNITQCAVDMSYRPVTPYRRDRSTAITHDEAYEMNATRSATRNTLRVGDTRYQPLASWEDLHSGDQPVSTASDEAHETNVTRSATNNTVRVVDESYYRPLASSDDTLPGASSQVGAYGTPVTRDSISSAPRQGETTHDPESNSSTIRGSNEELQRGKALKRLKTAYMRGALDGWLYEVAALAFSVGCLVALAVVLGIYDKKKTPEFAYNITLNALISVLSTAAKSSLLFAIAGTLGQVKWAWFTENRQLSDMQTFDDATRGPWGALILLCSRRIRPLASLGAAITILALAYGPFLQQLVRYPVIYESVANHEAATKRATTFNATNNFTNWDSTMVAAWLDINQFDRVPDCPTGNCTWPTFTSLGYCSKCGDTTAETSLNCSAVFEKWDAKSNETCEIHPDQGYPATVLRGLAINSTNWSYSTADSIVWVIRLTSTYGSNDALYEPFNTPDPVPKSAFQSMAGAKYSYLGVENPMLVLGYASFEKKFRRPNSTSSTLSVSSPPVLLKADTCIITPCERTYQLSMTAGQLRTVVIDTDYRVSEILGGWSGYLEWGVWGRCWHTTSYRGTDDAPVLPVKDCTLGALVEPAVTACHGGDATPGYIFCMPDDVSHTGVYKIGLLGREGDRVSHEGGIFHHANNGPEENRQVMGIGFPTNGKTTIQAIQAHNFSYLMERMAASMTKAELDNSSTLVYGNMTSPVVHVEVAWQWFILPAALNALAIFLLLATAVLSHHRKTQLWKSSMLALLYHGLDNPEPAPNLTMANVSEMERWASATSARLGPVKDGGRAVLRTLPRGQAPKD
jgi:hypothetical protein